MEVYDVHGGGIFSCIGKIGTEILVTLYFNTEDLILYILSQIISLSGRDDFKDRTYPEGTCAESSFNIS